MQRKFSFELQKYKKKKHFFLVCICSSDLFRFHHSHKVLNINNIFSLLLSHIQIFTAAFIYLKVELKKS